MITPRKQGLRTFNGLVSNIDWERIIFGGDDIPSRDIIISDSAYYAQPNRKTVFLYQNFRYIYNRIDKSEELYDIDWDPNQDFNLINEQMLDVDRHVIVKSRELYFYPHWDELQPIREKLRQVKSDIWREPSRKHIIVSKLKANKFIRRIVMPVAKKFLLSKNIPQ